MCTFRWGFPFGAFVLVARVPSLTLSLVALSSRSRAMSVASLSDRRSLFHRSFVAGSTGGACGMRLIFSRGNSVLTEAAVSCEFLQGLLLRLSLVLRALSSAASTRDVGLPVSQFLSTLVASSSPKMIRSSTSFFNILISVSSSSTSWTPVMQLGTGMWVA